jgi:hypothetical protein
MARGLFWRFEIHTTDVLRYVYFDFVGWENEHDVDKWEISCCTILESKMIHLV